MGSSAISTAVRPKISRYLYFSTASGALAPSNIEALMASWLLGRRLLLLALQNIS